MKTRGVMKLHMPYALDAGQEPMCLRRGSAYADRIDEVDCTFCRRRLEIYNSYDFVRPFIDQMRQNGASVSVLLIWNELARRCVQIELAKLDQHVQHLRTARAVVLREHLNLTRGAPVRAAGSISRIPL